MKLALTPVVIICCLLLAVEAGAQCPPSCEIPGGGVPETDCHAEFAGTGLYLNFPPSDPRKPALGTATRCFDGDAGCDSDGTVNGVCTFDIDVCLFNADPALPLCEPDSVATATVETAGDPDLEALQAALDALLPASASVCTEGLTLRVPLTESGEQGTMTVNLQVGTEGGATDPDQLHLGCVPREWPSHGYNHSNHRTNPNETQLSPDNVEQLGIKWHLDLSNVAPGLKAVTSTPTVGFGRVYVTSWNGGVYAVDPETAEVEWSYSAPAFIGLQSSATLTPDGRLLVCDSNAVVHCLDAETGRLLWMTDLADREFSDPPVDHCWSSPVVANNRVFVGIASHTDNPCTRGRLMALNLVTGSVLWRRQTVPDRVCDNDTSVECESNDECGTGNCVLGRGAGVTASSAVDPSGEVVYMNTVGCYTYPSIGDSDTMFRLDAATGNVIWKNRVQAPEQFGACSDNPAIDCRNAGDCESGECTEKSNYHDFGFLNGPLLIDADDGLGGTRRLVVSGSKDGTLYSFDPATGDIVWTNEIVPTPVTPGFAGYGLFNGAIAYANQRIHAALFFVIPPGNPEPQHLMTFSATDGTTLWEDEIGRSWSHVTVANNLLFAGTERTVRVCAEDVSRACSNNDPCPSGACVTRGQLHVYDARDGRRLKTFLMPDKVVGGASVVDGTVYVPYGGFPATAGGVTALTLAGCLGDCDRSNSVEIDEVLTGIGIGLGTVTMNACASFDRNSDFRVTVDELVGGVDNVMSGCD